VIVGWAVGGLFVIMVSALWLMMFPAVRERWFNAAADVWRNTIAVVFRSGAKAKRWVGHASHSALGEAQETVQRLRRHRMILAVSALLLIAPPVMILSLRQQVVLQGFTQDDLSVSESAIAQLMRGERLVPPAPPPPEVFTTAEIRREHPEIVTADRKWQNLDPDLQQRVLAIFQILRTQYHIEMVLVEGFRSPERQAELMAQGQATRAGAWQSCHQYGLAIDAAPIRAGKLQWNMSEDWTRRAYFLYGGLARQAGLDWGGDWRSLKDYVHVERSAECRQARRERQARG
jgi:peptidoglycan L-alanyl-D-glutamate endopeptidase CwlK